MGYINFLNGFNVQTASAIDKRILLTKAEMKTAEDVYMLPDIYFCICLEDGKFYIYNKNNSVDTTTGKYRVIDESITFTSEAAKAQLNEAIKNSVEIVTIKQEVAELQTTVSEVKDRVEVLEPKVTVLEEKVGDDTSGLIKRVADAEEAISDLEPRIVQAEEDIQDIETWINNVKLDGGEIKVDYNLAGTLTNVIADASNPVKIGYKQSAVLLFTAASSYALPESIKVNGNDVAGVELDLGTVTAKWVKAEGKLYLSKATNDVAFIIVGVEV